MNPAANHCPLPKFELWSLALDSARQLFRPFGPFSPATPLFPAIRSGHRLFQRPSPGKQFPSNHAYEQLRLKLLKSGVVQEQGDDIVFAKDHLFKKPSPAAAALMGRTANGWAEWKTKDGKTLDAVKRQAPDQG